MELYISTCLSCLVLATLTQGLLKDISAYQGFITTIHNFYRSYERAANMKELQWDPYLQGRAEQWSENCFWDHQRDGLGENLAYFWTNGPAFSSMEVIVKSCQNWWKEVHDWQWSTDCGVACHYTQMIWGNTERIGCALSMCPSLRTESGQTFNNSDFFVCFYDPPGNFIGKHPYTLGEPCTQCDIGESCNAGLCSRPSKASNNRPPSVNMLDQMQLQPDSSVTYSEAVPLVPSAPKTFVRKVVYTWTN
ncbi:cysteine-rich secretory protein LCCL domain-containing 2-like [Ruditapes philippinarum]|uniref:cysteine-rich secretory protein LCCL domain-containing 2-like n=1 Tax=Ruditapes philippinarum TaxID=129788 RepID=UPI00295A690E|nr:cysteine-rich secretory protein LCCL domain-containing 2-like [Ruditapes philippinarum]